MKAPTAVITDPLVFSAVILEKLNVCSIEYPDQMFLDKNMNRRARVKIFIGEEEYQGLGEWKGERKWGSS